MESNGHRDFKGFTPQTFEFLIELSINNNKGWFESNRGRYESFVLRPLLELASDLGPFMITIDPSFDIRPGVDKTISRIRRDTRFPKDKSPYRSNLWITFKRKSTDWKDDPSYFFEIFPDWYRFGMGYYNAPKQAMDRMRNFIEYRTVEFRDIISSCKGRIDFAVEGERYKRIINSDIPQDLLEWYQKKDIYLSCSRRMDDLLFGPGLVDDLKEGFGKLTVLYNFFRGLK